METKPIILDDKKFALFGKRVEGGSGQPKMSFGVFKGNPSITVFLNDPKDTEKSPIRAGMDAVHWGMFVSLVLAIADSVPGTEKPLKMINRKGAPNKRFTDSIMVVGKDERGVVYFGLTKEGRPNKKFELMPGLYHEIVMADGNPMDPGLQSVLFTKGFMDQLNAHMTHYMRETYEPAQAPGGSGRQGGGRGGFGGGGGNSGGGNRSYGSSNRSGGYDDFSGGAEDDGLPM